MSRSHSSKGTCKPYEGSLRLRKSDYVPSYGISELFDDEALQDKLVIARNRVAAAFYYAERWSRGRYRPCEYIVGLGPKQKDLVEYVMETVIGYHHRGIVTIAELPTWLGKDPHMLRRIADRAEHNLVALALNELVKERHVWYNKYYGTWETQQSILDEYIQQIKTAREIRKVDEQLRREALHADEILEQVH